jgi:hypothetical protein
VTQRWSRLADEQATTVDMPHKSPWHEPALETERILMVDFASTHARTKEVAPSVSHEGGQAEVAVAKLLNTSPAPTINGVDRLYHQLVGIHVITRHNR